MTDDKTQVETDELRTWSRGAHDRGDRMAAVADSASRASTSSSDILGDVSQIFVGDVQTKVAGLADQVRDTATYLETDAGDAKSRSRTRSTRSTRPRRTGSRRAAAVISDMVNVGGGDNWDISFAGGGPLDSVSQVVKSIQSDDGFSIGVNAAVAAADLLGALESPLKTIAGSAMGWLIEQRRVPGRLPRRTAGDPVAVEAAVRTLQNAARELDKLAGEHIDALSQVPTYAEGGSGSFNAFFGTVMPRARTSRRGAWPVRDSPAA